MKIVTTSIVLCAVVIFFYVCGIGIKNIIRYNVFEFECSTLLSQLKTETDTNKAYKRRLLEMKENDYWEVQAKRRLGFIRKNEKVYKILNVKNN